VNKVGILGNMNDPKAPPQREEIEEVARASGISLVIPETRNPEDVEVACLQALPRMSSPSSPRAETSSLINV
jgi:hypothetical protein